MPLEVDGVKYFSADEVADRAEVSRQTLWRWRQDCLVPAGRKYRGRRLLFSEDDLQAVLEFAHRIQPVQLGRDDEGDSSVRIREGGTV